jgi:DtxR family transcriptional regulator, manganese transport regulator
VTETKRPNRFARAREDHARELAEDYVELIQELQREEGVARTKSLAARLSVSQPTVTKSLTRLEKEGWLVVVPHRSIELTESGKSLAADSRKRHEMVVAFLVAVGVSAEVAELDAEGIEHHVSEATLAAMQAYLARS